MGKFLLMLATCLAFLAEPLIANGKDMSVVFIPKSRDQDFWVFMRDGVEKGIREDGPVELTWRGPTYNDKTDEQIQILQLYTNPSVDAIIIAPTDRARLAAPVARAVAAGIKIVVVDSALDGEPHWSFITTDNFAAGQLAAEKLSALLHGRGNVLLLRTIAGSGSTEERANGFLDHMKKHAPNIRVVADEYGGATRGQAARSAERLLGKHPRIDGIFAVNESSSDGMLRALRQLQLTGKKKFVGFDATDYLLGGLAKGEINGLVVQDPRQMGYLAIKAAIAAVRNASAKERERVIYTPAVVVTPENYQQPEIRALLVP